MALIVNVSESKAEKLVFSKHKTLYHVTDSNIFIELNKTLDHVTILHLEWQLMLEKYHASLCDKPWAL